MKLIDDVLINEIYFELLTDRNNYYWIDFILHFVTSENIVHC